MNPADRIFAALHAMDERRQAVEPPDCGDNSCRFAKSKGGMRTNGGCRCYRDNSITQRHYVLKLRILHAEHELLSRAVGVLLTVVRGNETFHRLGGIDDCEPCTALAEVAEIFDGKG